MPSLDMILLVNTIKSIWLCFSTDIINLITSTFNSNKGVAISTEVDTYMKYTSIMIINSTSHAFSADMGAGRGYEYVYM